MRGRVTLGVRTPRLLTMFGAYMESAGIQVVKNNRRGEACPIAILFFWWD